MPDGAVHTDYQEMKIQEAASTNGTTMSNRPMPRSLLIKLQHDLVGTSSYTDTHGSCPHGIGLLSFCFVPCPFRFVVAVSTVI